MPSLTHAKNTLVSYAQNREDFYLYALLGHIKKGFYVDVGANHPDLHSVTKLFYDRGWKGINIEPNTLLHKRMQKQRKRDINLNVGASNKNGKLKLRLYPMHDGLSTFSKEIMKFHTAANLPHEDVVVPVTTLKTILKKHEVKEIDFMKIDVEGHEAEVILGNDWAVYRPKVVLIEATVADSWEKTLLGHGYVKEFFDGLNYYYIAKEHRKEITIYNYAERILKAPSLSHKEAQLLTEVERLTSQLAGSTRLRNQLILPFRTMLSILRLQFRKLTGGAQLSEE